MPLFKTTFCATAVALFASTAVSGDIAHTENTQHVMATKVVEIGDLQLTEFRARATLPNQPVGGGYLTINNKGGEDDVLLSVSTPVSDRSEIHEMAMVDDQMKMRALPDGLVIPAGESVELKPGGFHLMFMGLDAPLVDGTLLEVTLTFANAGDVTVPFAIMKMNMKHKHSH